MNRNYCQSLADALAKSFPSIRFWSALAVALFGIALIGILAPLAGAWDIIVNIVPGDDGQYYNGMPRYIYSLRVYMRIVIGFFGVASAVLALVLVIKLNSKRAR